MKLHSDARGKGADAGNARSFPRFQVTRGHYASFPGGSSAIRDLSLGGVMLNDRDPLLPGSRIRLNLHLGMEVVSCDGFVRRFEPGKGMGIEFTELSPIARSRLNHYLLQRNEAASRARCGGAATGERVPTVTDLARSIRLGELLVGKGVITSAALAAATNHASPDGGQLPATLVGLGVVSENDLASLLSEQYRLTVIDLASIEPTLGALQRVPHSLARRHAILPIGLADSTLTVAIADPTNLAGLNEVKFRSGCSLRVALAPARSLAEAIDRYYRERTRAAG